MALNQNLTLAQPVTCSGIGLHTGLVTKVCIFPVPLGTGRYFVRVDLPELPIIPARIESVASTALSTELVQADSTLDPKPNVCTVEHLLSALAGMGIDHARIEIDGPEVPLLDGSSQIWTEAIAQAGSKKAQPTSDIHPFSTQGLTPDFQRKFQSLLPISVHQGDAFVTAFPAAELRFTYGIDFPSSVIGNSWYSWSPHQASFTECLAPARTFVLEAQVQQLRERGLIKGGSLDNALVCGESGWLNPPLRFPDEPVRHKMLDLIGDLSLLGMIVPAHYVAYKAGHSLHTQLAQRIQDCCAL
ncbi:MAG: UDP-3-O-acyl-N-acetylglucosamine deacetylase [Microcoleaceae cyanobacterium]